MSGAKRKTIKKILRHKLNSWIDTIDDKNVKELVKRDVFVTGGSIASMLLGETINDYDVYFKTKETTLEVAKYYCAKFNEANPNADVKPYIKEISLTNIKGETEERVVVWVQSAGAASDESDDGTYQYFEMTDNADGDLANEYVDKLLSGMKMKTDDETRGRAGQYIPKFLSQNAITLSDKVQIVIRFYGSPEEIYKNYDFVHVCNHYDYHTDDLCLNPKALESLLSRTLYYQGSLYPICSIFRSKKFIERGWKISAGQLLKMAFQVSEIDLKDLPTLREQLCGVDQAYFHQVISMIEAEKNNNPDVDIDSSYVVQLVDKIFD